MTGLSNHNLNKSSDINSENFHSALAQLYHQTTHSKSVSYWKEKAWQKYRELGLPHKKQKLWKHVPIHQWYLNTYTPLLKNAFLPSKQEILPHILKESLSSYIVFVNGIFEPSLGNLKELESVSVAPLHTHHAYSSYLNHRMNAIIQEEKNSFSALNAALFQEGSLIYLPPNVVVKSPIQILDITYLPSNHTLCLPRIHLYASKNSSATICYTSVQVGESFIFSNQVVDLFVEEGANIYWYDLQKGTDHSFGLTSTKVIVEANASVRIVNMTPNHQIDFHDYQILLKGMYSQAHLYGACHLHQNKQAHTHVFMEHKAPHTQSIQLFKSALEDKSQSSFEGKIYVHPEAQKTDAFQLNNNLLLSEEAVAISKPNLEILADDVKASHGSTTGKPNDQIQFYLKTRGLFSEEVDKLLVQGFIQEVKDYIVGINHLKIT